jgi:hypothetical protein
MLQLDPDHPWPVHEMIFLQMADPGTLTTGACRDGINQPESGLWGQTLPLTQIGYQIHDFNNTMAAQPSSHFRGPLGTVAALSAKLDRWESRLPLHHKQTGANVEFWAYHKLGHVLVAMHIGYHYHAILLYYRFLYLAEKHANNLEYRGYSDLCKRHAIGISELVWSSHQDYGVVCAWLMVSHLRVIASTVHLHTLLLDKDEAAIKQAKILLARNFETLLP